VGGIPSELQTRNAWLLVPLSSNPMGTIANFECIPLHIAVVFLGQNRRRFPLKFVRLPVSDLKECPYSVEQFTASSFQSKLVQGRPKPDS